MLDDVKCAWRRIRGAPGLTALAVMTLALAIGANTAIFSIADAVLFRPLPYDYPDRVFVLQMLNRQTGARFTSTGYEFIQAIDQHHQGLSTVGLLDAAPNLVVTTDQGAEFVARIAVSANYFDILGVVPARGRLFHPADARIAGRPAVLSYAAWQQRFGASESVVGRAITLGTTTFDIVGVLPASFVFPSAFAGRPEIVTVLPPVAVRAPGGAFHPIVRLENGVTRESAQAELDALSAPIAGTNPRFSAIVPVLDDVRAVLYPVGRPIMRFLLAAAALVLLVGCANLAGTLLARNHWHERDMGVRAALGASRARLLRSLIFEALFIGLAGAAGATLMTMLTFDALLPHVPPLAYRNAPVGVSLRVIIFALALGVVASLGFAIVPAYRSTALDVQALLQRRSHEPRLGRWRFGTAMVALQVGLAVAVVFGTVVATRAFVSVLRVPLGFTPENVVTMRILPRESGNARQAFYVRAIETIARRGDVVAAGAAGSLPLAGSAPDDGVRAGDGRQMLAGIVYVLPGYFETTGIRLVRGRLPNLLDVSSNPDAAVVSESAARALFPTSDPLGGTFSNGDGRRFSVVGVVSDVVTRLDRESPALAYALPGDAAGIMTIVVRTKTRDAALARELSRELTALSPATPVITAWWSDSIRAVTAYRNPRFQTLVLGTFAALSLGLVAVGIFGVVAFLVVVRTREMGVRLAIGATPHSLVALMVKQTLMPVVAGLVIGLVATNWLARLAEAQLFAVDARDLAARAIAAAIVVAAALLAAYLPARRAGRLDPVVVLRAE